MAHFYKFIEFIDLPAFFCRFTMFIRFRSFVCRVLLLLPAFIHQVLLCAFNDFVPLFCFYLSHNALFQALHKTYRTKTSLIFAFCVLTTLYVLLTFVFVVFTSLVFFLSLTKFFAHQCYHLLLSSSYFSLIYLTTVSEV